MLLIPRLSSEFMVRSLMVALMSRLTAEWIALPQVGLRLPYNRMRSGGPIKLNLESPPEARGQVRWAK